MDRSLARRVHTHMASEYSDSHSGRLFGSPQCLNTALRNPNLVKSPETKLTSRLLAQVFRKSILSTYPSIKPEPVEKAYPLFLNVGASHCVELPFGHPCSIVRTRSQASALYTCFY